MIIVFLQIKPAKYGFFKKSEITIFLNIQLACMAGRIVSGSKVLVEVLQRHAENDTLPLLDMAALPSKLSHVQKQIHHLHWLNIQFKKNSIEIKVVMWLNIPPPPPCTYVHYTNALVAFIRCQIQFPTMGQDAKVASLTIHSVNLIENHPLHISQIKNYTDLNLK